MTRAQPDRWSRWLLARRDGGDDAQRAQSLEHLGAIRDRVLDGAAPLDGATLLDVGTGDGLIGVAALERVGPSGHVIFSDVSPVLLQRCRERAGDSARASFVCTRAEDLGGVADASVDAVTTRSVLIYVRDKAAAFAAFARVLRPGGRLSLFEPINRLMHPEPDGRFWGFDVAAVADLAVRVSSQFAGDPEDRDAMIGFDDRDLVELALGAGFAEVHCERHITVEPGASLQPTSFDTLLDTAPNPNAPTIREALTAALDEHERPVFVDELRAAFQEGRAQRRMAVAYLRARL